MTEPDDRGRQMTYDVVAVGCGPFNLGLAALATGVDGLGLAVFEDRPEFTWHRGLMFGDAMLQVSFLADLVSLVEPAQPAVVPRVVA
jgi:lysine N6-hydroxylase